jgi:hypothetical protein
MQTPIKRGVFDKMTLRIGLRDKKNKENIRGSFVQMEAVTIFAPL